MNKVEIVLLEIVDFTHPIQYVPSAMQLDNFLTES